MIKYFVILFSAAALSTLSAQTAADIARTDRLGQALNEVGLSRDKLGFHPKGYWNRFPQPRHIPHILPFFEDLFAEPLKVYDFAKTMGNAAVHYLDPVHFDTAGNCLYNLVYLTGVDRKLIGFRNFGVNLNPAIGETEPMLDAFEQIYGAFGKQLDFMTFDRISDWPNHRKELESKLALIPIEIQRPVAALMLNLLDASRWRKTAVRNIDFRRQSALFDIADLAETIGDGQVYYPEIDDIAASLDEHSLYYAAMKAVQAAETCYKELKKAVAARKKDLSRLHVEFDSPLGKVVVCGTGGDETDYLDAAILIDLGGNDRHSGNCGATISPEKSLSVLIDLSGDDRYLNKSAAFPSQGSAVLGAGILIDGSGDDLYEAERQAQGSALFGLGLLLDIEGDDDYRIDSVIVVSFDIEKQSKPEKGASLSLTFSFVKIIARTVDQDPGAQHRRTLRWECGGLVQISVIAGKVDQDGQRLFRRYRGAAIARMPIVTAEVDQDGRIEVIRFIAAGAADHHLAER